ncbi:MAG: DUF3991 and TOPRIM domain-containing protein [Rhodospirillales bacterium]|nr:DUF3991 and TOPRIM domain-containing protein [Rhodospirillales bacterium]
MGDWRESSWEDLVRSARGTALEGVALSLGYRRDGRDRSRWRCSGSIVSINGAKFFDHLQGRGGGGAIDLVMHARGCGFREAVAFLSAAAAASGDPGPRPQDPPGRGLQGRPRRRALGLPPASEALWPAVRDHLVERRGLDPALVEACRRRGTVYADRRRNAVFVSRNASGAATGAEISGTGRSAFKGMAPGSRKALGGFWMSLSGRPADPVLLAESAIDALSALSMPALPDADFTAVSAAGRAPGVPPWVVVGGRGGILCGYYPDAAGDAAAERLCRADGRAARLRPGAEGADWNDLLPRLRSGCGTASSRCRSL